MTERAVIQFITLALSLIGIYQWARRYRVRPSVAIPAIGWLLHIAIYYAFVLFIEAPELGNVFYTTWSAAIRLHGVISLTLIIYIDPRKSNA